MNDSKHSHGACDINEPLNDCKACFENASEFECCKNMSIKTGWIYFYEDRN